MLEEFILKNLSLNPKDLLKLINSTFKERYTYDQIQKKRMRLKQLHTNDFGLPLYEQDDMNEVTIKDMSKYSPVYPKIKYSKSDGNLLIIDPADIHIGKLAVSSETGDNYSSSKAIDIVKKSVDKIISRATNFNISKICLVIGNDVLHIDNLNNQTTRGTPQDTDGLWHENFKEARKMYVSIIERLMQIAPVHVVFNPSNHDYMSGYFLADTLECWFNKSKDVTFDISIKHRKFMTFGENLIMTSHGDEAKETDYAYLMPNEEPELWASTKFRYVYLHHIHHKKVIKYKSGSDFNGVTIEYLRSPSAADAWHYRNGYCVAPKAVEAFIHSPTEGQIARITVKV